MSANRVRIFFVLGSFKLGGTERTASRVGMELIRRGYNVKFLLINGVFDYTEPSLIENSIVLQGGEWRSKTLKTLAVYWNLFWLVWSNRPARVLSFSLWVNVLVFFVGYPQTIFRIETNIFIYERIKRYKKYIQKLLSLFPHVRKVVVPSAGLLEACQKYFYTPGKIVQIDNPVDQAQIDSLKTEPLNDFPMLVRGKYIVSAGRLSLNKGFEQLIRVYKKSRLFPSFKLVLLGDGPMRDRIVSVINQEGLQDYVILTGYQSNPYRFFSGSCFFVLNSDHESFGNVLIEAFASGVPAVSNDCDFGPRHIIDHGQNGLLYDQHNEKDFIAALETAALDDQVYLRLKAGAMNSSKKYAVDIIVDDWISRVIGTKPVKNTTRGSDA